MFKELCNFIQSYNKNKLFDPVVFSPYQIRTQIHATFGELRGDFKICFPSSRTAKDMDRTLHTDL